MSNAVMPLAHYKETCDVIRKKTGSTDTIKSGEMPDKINDVFRAGQLDIVSSAEALKGSASGSLVALNDVSPVEHNVKCLVSSDTITDSSVVKVKKYGKNLCNTGTATFTRGITIELPTPLPAKTPFVFSSIFESDYTGSSNLIQFNYTDGTSCSNADMASWNTKKPTERQLCTRANGLPKDLKSISFYAGYGWGNSGGYTGTLTNVQLEIGSTVTDYEPYSCTEHTANSDGTVEGIKSLYPNMTLLTDTEGVIVTAEYIKDIDKAFEERLAEIEKALVNN